VAASVLFGAHIVRVQRVRELRVADRIREAGEAARQGG
jgi:hypothetical protein